MLTDFILMRARICDRRRGRTPGRPRRVSVVPGDSGCTPAVHQVKRVLLDGVKVLAVTADEARGYVALCGDGAIARGKVEIVWKCEGTVT